MAVGQIQRVDFKLAPITIESIDITHIHTSILIIHSIIIEYNMHMNNCMYNRCQISTLKTHPDGYPIARHQFACRNLGDIHCDFYRKMYKYEYR